MNILTKHKKKGEDGFKKFICNLETSTEAKQKEILEVAFLEDPVYISAVIPNLISAEFITKLSRQEVLKVYNNLSNPIKMFLYAFLNTPTEKILVNELLPSNLKRIYDDEKEVTSSLKTGEQETARFTIVKIIRSLQERLEIERFKWKLPSPTVLNGTHLENPKDGMFSLTYEENNVPALEGNYKSKQRDGKWFHYYPNGKTMAVGYYTCGEKSGDWIFNFTSGAKKASGAYRDNLKQGQWILYDKDGIEKFVFYDRGRIK
ncbi:MAG: hypothetical protein A2381_10230 [Bdellovibrionales bacterium RIFOXYB1_FULL_37_110]|nr:MAG: hypothetical protein A2417_02745 [Bdellovibrionales bacterium RIFOXYC1_FULL_37_79]OFZ61142.1 MAG: hypothetical protein A2381_10230 [Bdellovibrionales bacterium RIFOXYB1_FULL_37_110]OFZ65593.1 MAG: hypothetical protein A2577_02415 [Bdellovibrionales bacterium RIFOXYD1_FULL_36_51]